MDNDIFPHELLAAVERCEVWQYDESWGRRVYLRKPGDAGRGRDVTGHIAVLAQRGLITLGAAAVGFTHTGVPYRLTPTGKAAVGPLVRAGIKKSRYAVQTEAFS